MDIMKKFGICILLSLLGTVSFSQSYEASVQYDKKKQAAFAIDYSYSPEAVENAFVQKLAKMGYKAKEEKGILNRDKGFLVYKNTYLTAISNERLDVMVRVDRKSRKESDASILYMILMKGDKNAMDVLDATGIGNAKSFLNNMLPEVEAADLELQIKAQEELVAKSEKRLRDLKEEQTNLERKLQDNKTNQENTQKEIESQKQALGVLVGKRKTGN